LGLLASVGGARVDRASEVCRCMYPCIPTSGTKTAARGARVQALLTAYQTNIAKVTKKSFNEGMEKLEKLRLSWVKLSELVDDEIKKLEVTKAMGEEKMKSLKRAQLACYVGAGLTVLAGVAVSVGMIVASGGATAVPEIAVAAVGVACATTSVASAGTAGAAAGLLACGSVLGQAIKAAKKMVSEANDAQKSYTEVAKQLQTQVEILKMLHVDCARMQLALEESSFTLGTAKQLMNKIDTKVSMSLTVEVILKSFLEMPAERSRRPLGR